MKTIISLMLSAFIFVSVSAQIKEKKNDLVDKTYSIQLTLTSGKGAAWQWTTDEISFRTGFLKSKVMREHEKFADAACTIDEKSNPSGSTMTFKAEGMNPGGSKIKWNGKVTGDHIEGTAVWTNAQGKQSYSFTGTIKAK